MFSINIIAVNSFANVPEVKDVSAKEATPDKKEEKTEEKKEE